MKWLSQASGSRSHRRRSVPRSSQRPASGSGERTRPSASVLRHMPSAMRSPTQLDRKVGQRLAVAQHAETASASPRRGVRCGASSSTSIAMFTGAAAPAPGSSSMRALLV